MSRANGERHSIRAESGALISELAKQKAYVHGIASIKRPCPYCGVHFDLYEATRGQFDVDETATLSKECPSCGIQVRDDLGFLDGQYFWTAFAPLREGWTPYVEGTA